LWSALSRERTVLSFVHAADPCQRSISWVRNPWDSRPYFTVSDLRLPFSPSPSTRRVTVEVFYPASTREHWSQSHSILYRFVASSTENTPIAQQRFSSIAAYCCSHYLATVCLSRIYTHVKVFIEPLPSNVSIRHSVVFMSLLAGKNYDDLHSFQHVA
jgi:hypothetical protein